MTRVGEIRKIRAPRNGHAASLRQPKAPGYEAADFLNSGGGIKLHVFMKIFMGVFCHRIWSQ